MTLFTPTLASVPEGWEIALNFATISGGFHHQASVAIDASGNVWVTNVGEDSVTELNSSGSLVGNFAPSGANLNRPVGVALGNSGNVWVVNNGNSEQPGRVHRLGRSDVDADPGMSPVGP